jgi:hypothetical protein
VDIIGARVQHSPKFNGADIRAGADPRDVLKRARAATLRRF